MTSSPTDELPEGVESRTVNEDGVIVYRDSDGQPHNPVGPAVIHPDRATYWLVTGRDPNEKVPWWFCSQYWFRHGKLHRNDGPASIHGDGLTYYYLDDTHITEEQFHQQNQASHEASATDYQT